MGWRFAELAEVARRPHDAFAEVILPQAIHQHAGRQGMIVLRQPRGELQTAAAAGDWTLLVTGEDFGTATRHQVAETIVSAAMVNADIVNAGVRTAGNAA